MKDIQNAGILRRKTRKIQLFEMSKVTDSAADSCIQKSKVGQ